MRYFQPVATNVMKGFRMDDFEKLGVFYLGRERDLDIGRTSERLVLYDSKDLTTHALVLGMTGSGKTGLCVSLLEEAGLDRIPAVVVDPKGDIANLLLTFPNLSPAEFRPWIDEAEAQRAGKSPDEFAEAEAARWQQGLAEWGETADRIRRFRDEVELRIYTPGSSAGRGINLLRGFAPPRPELLTDLDAFRERITATASGLLSLVGIAGDPLRSREHILVSKLLETAWTARRELDLPRLIREVQTPPFDRLGVLEVDQFFPPKERGEFALALNSLLASPMFASWMEGDPLDISELMYTGSGRPCISILSIAHLPEAQRMFFVTLLLNELLAWVRSQTGTPSLRAIFYMDEIQGYFPPVANPPSKAPMLTLLKQARAFGVGVVLATQNPVDLDYKGLANIGTWFLGRLQTERDKERVLEGLEGAGALASAALSRSELDSLLSSLGKRQFLLHNVHESQPVVLETRWAMSYLRGPLSRVQIQALATPANAGEANAEGPAAGASAPDSKPAARPPSTTADRVTPEELDHGQGLEIDEAARLQVPAEVAQFFAQPTQIPAPPAELVYRPAIWAEVRLYFAKSSAGVDHAETRGYWVVDVDELSPAEVWRAARRCGPGLRRESTPLGGAHLARVPAPLQSSKNWKAWERALGEFLYREQELLIWQCAALDVYSQPSETLSAFRARLEQLASERRDRDAEKLRQKYAPKFQSLRERIERGEHRVARETEEYQQKRRDSWLHAGATILGAVLGRKKISATNVGKASTSIRTAGRAAAQRGDIARAAESLETLQQRLDDLDLEFQAALQSLATKLDVAQLPLDEIRIRPKRTDIQIQHFGLLWVPEEKVEKVSGTN